MIGRKKRKVPEPEIGRRYNNPYFPKQEKLALEKVVQKDWWVYLIIILVIVFCFCLIFFRLSIFKIDQVSIAGTKNINTQEIEEVVNYHLGSNKLILFKKSNYWLFSEKGLRGDIEENLKDKILIKELKVETSWPMTLTVEIKESIPNLAWITDGKQYYLDLDGVVTQKIDNTESSADLPIIYDQNNLSINISDQVISKELVDFVIKIIEEFPNKLSVGGIEIESFSIPEIKCQEKKIIPTEVSVDSQERMDIDTEEDGLTQQKRDIQERFKDGEISIDESLILLENLRREYVATNPELDSEDFKIEYEEIFEDFPCDYIKTVKDIEVTTNEGWKIYLTLYLDFDQQINNLNLVLKEKLTQRENLEYIDVRFTDRVYFK